VQVTRSTRLVAAAQIGTLVLTIAAGFECFALTHDRRLETFVSVPIAIAGAIIVAWLALTQLPPAQPREAGALKWHALLHLALFLEFGGYRLTCTVLNGNALLHLALFLEFGLGAGFLEASRTYEWAVLNAVLLAACIGLVPCYAAMAYVGWTRARRALMQ